MDCIEFLGSAQPIPHSFWKIEYESLYILVYAYNPYIYETNSMKFMYLLQLHKNTIAVF